VIRRYSLVTPAPETDPTFAMVDPNADVAQLVEHQLPKLRVAGSIPVVRFTKSLLRRLAAYRPDAVEIILLRIC
jgi:NAD-dependent oxidoreductase involved in siderophore biosynthesis